MLETNGERIGNDGRCVAEVAEIRPEIYFQFDGFEPETYRVLRGEPDILPEKFRALDRLAAIGCRVNLVPAVKRAGNEPELGEIVGFGLEQPAIMGTNFQPAFHTQ